MIASGFTWFHVLIDFDSETWSFAHGHGYAFVTAWFVCGILILFGLLANRALASATSAGGLSQFEADGTLTIRTLAELLVGFIRNMMGGLLDDENTAKWMWLVGGLFTYIFTCNILGIIPGFLPPTDIIHANVGMAIIALVAYWVVGLTNDPKSFAAHIFGPVPFLMPLIGAIELLGLLAIRPVTLALRLTGNMFADHTVFSVMSSVLPPLLPVPFLALAILVSAIQAFVFALLTTIYISLSLPHGDHDDHHH